MKGRLARFHSQSCLPPEIELAAFRCLPIGNPFHELEKEHTHEADRLLHGTPIVQTIGLFQLGAHFLKLRQDVTREEAEAVGRSILFKKVGELMIRFE